VPRFAANISTLYPEHAMVDRIAAAAHDGFAAVEVQSPYAVAAADLQRALRGARMRLVLMNAPQGDMDAGERGLAALPGRERDFDESLEQALDYARTLGVPRVHVMAGKPAPDAGKDAERAFVRNIAQACRHLGPHGIGVTIEPINTRDMQGYFLTRPEQAALLIAEIGAANLALQFDCYHAQIMGGDLATRLNSHFALIGHVQIAGVPERHEPDTGEVQYPALFKLLDRLGYRGWVGCEYRPARGAAAGGTSAGLAWMRRA
jgi:2-dehydrotetronate isomerase